MAAQLEPSVAAALVDKEEYVSLMQHPKVANAIRELRSNPGRFGELCAADPELERLFGELRHQMNAAEAEEGVDAGGGEGSGGGGDDDDPPPLLSTEEAAAEEARARGAHAFGAGRFVDACEAYERASRLQHDNHLHWSNLAAAQLKCGRLRPALDSARECVRLEPRFAKGHLRVGQVRQPQRRLRRTHPGRIWPSAPHRRRCGHSATVAPLRQPLRTDCGGRKGRSVELSPRRPSAQPLSVAYLSVVSSLRSPSLPPARQPPANSCTLCRAPPPGAAPGPRRVPQ